MIKLSAAMAEALEFYSEDRTDEAVAFPRTGTRVALIRRGLLTTGNHAWDHELTADGWAALRSGQTMAEAHEMALELNAEITVGIREGQYCLDQTEAKYSDEEVAERIERRRELLDAYITGYEGRSKHRRHQLRMVKAHAFWLGLYVAERDRRSRELAVNTYSAAVHNGLAQRGTLAATPLVQVHQAIQDLLHGEALEQYRAERPMAWACHMIQPRGIVTEIGLGQDLQLHTRNVPVDEVAALAADIQAAEAAGDITPGGGVILRPIPADAVSLPIRDTGTHL